MKIFDKNLPEKLVIAIFVYCLFLVSYIAIFQDKIFVAIISSLGTLLIQNYLEKRRNIRKQEDFSRLIINLIRDRSKILLFLRINVILSSDNSVDIKKILVQRYISRIQKDEIYKSALKDLGILPMKVIEYLSKYNSSLDDIYDSLLYHINHESGQGLSTSKIQENLAIQIIYNGIDAETVIMLICQKILENQEELAVSKKFLINEYWRVKNAIKQGENVPEIINFSLNQIEMAFTEIGLLSELLSYSESIEDLDNINNL